MPWLSCVIFSPLLGIVLLLLVDKENHALLKGIAFVTSILTFIMSLPLYFSFNLQTAQFQFVEMHEWVPQLVFFIISALTASACCLFC